MVSNISTSSTGFLLVSRNASATRRDVIDLARQARARNAQERITGILIFDGTHFTQYVEGPQVATVSLRDRLQKDGRHDIIRLVWQGTARAKRWFPFWRMGYLPPSGPDHLALTEARTMPEPTALRSFVRVVARLDVQAMPA